MTITRPPEAAEAGGEHPTPPEPAIEAPERFNLLDRLRIDRLDLYLMGGFLLVAFFVRFCSPLMLTWPDPARGQILPITNCVHNTPINAQNQLGTLCGLTYPYTRNGAQAGQPASPPEGEVFDEIYFGVFAHNDLKNVGYFDPEPPLSKLFIAAGEWLYGGYRAIFEGAQGNWADLGFNTFGWRIMPCVIGSLCIPLMYLLARRLWPSNEVGYGRLFAIAAAGLACFDGMFFIQSRIGMIDIIPIFLILFAYTLLLVHLDSRSERDSIVTLLLLGTACGLAVAAKWIALAAMASIVFWLIARPVSRHVRVALTESDWSWGFLEGPELPGAANGFLYVSAGIVAFVFIPVAIYLASWIFPFYTSGYFKNLHDLIAYNQNAYIYHATLTATHPYGSPWFSWPFLYRPVAYYYEYQSLGTDAITGHPLVAGMVDLGNPIIWWASIPAVLSLPYFVFRHRSFTAAVILVGFITQYLPWSRITRVIFLYHMFGGLIFMILALAFVLVRLQRMGSIDISFFGDRFVLGTRNLVLGFLLVVLLFFVYFYPVWTALPISDQAYLDPFPLGKMWIRTWI